MEQDSLHKAYTIFAFVTFAIMVALIIFAMFVLKDRLQSGAFRPGGQDTVSGELRTLYDLTQRGEFAASREDAAAKVGEYGTSTVAGQRALSDVATADFWSGDMQKRIEAVRATKEQLRMVPGSTYNQALLINRLLGYITTAMEPQVIDEIFNDEPYASMRVPGDDVASLKNLAKHSLSLEYTNLANFKVGIAQASAIFKHFDGIKRLSKADLDTRVSELRHIIDETSAHFDEEEKRISGRPFAELQAPAFYYFQGFLEATIALVQPAQLAEAEADFQKVEDYYTTTRTLDGGPNVMIGARLVYTNFSLATFKYAIRGETALPEVRAHLQRMIDLVQADPDAHKGAFLAFMHQTMLDGPEQPKGRWYSYGRFIQMAEAYAPFKQFLNSYGWELE